MSLLQKIHTSFTTRLSLWVAGFVTVILGVVFLLLASFSQETIAEETIDTTLQALENTALRIDNLLSQRDMTAQLEHKRVTVNQPLIERLIRENRYLDVLDQSLPHAHFYVTDSIFPGEKGYCLVKEKGQERYLFYEPIYNCRYSIVVTCLAKDVYSQFAEVQWLLVVTGVIGVLILLVILHVVISHHLRPLRVLADSAQRIADGHLNETIAKSRQSDEIGQLQNSLAKMQCSLSAYMEDMRQKQATLNNQHEALQAAYAEVQEYDQLKAKFLHDMTDQMVVSADTVSRATDIICRDYQQLSMVEMVKLQTEIQISSEAIVQLLDHVIKTPISRNSQSAVL